MHCPDCLSPQNRIVGSHYSGDMKIRIRKCACGNLWSTSEPVRRVCEICGGKSWDISRVEHNGPDQKMRLHTCRKCGNKMHTIERKISGKKQGTLKLGYR